MVAQKIKNKCMENLDIRNKIKNKYLLEQIT
jgi:hypothetical protein